MTQPDGDSNPRRAPAFTLVPTGNEEAGSPEPNPEVVRTDFWWIYERMGGRLALLEWAETNAKEFFRMFFQLFPRDAKAEVNSVTALVETLRELASEEAGCPAKDEDE